MACSITTTGRALPCKTALGGIKNVWIGVDAFPENGGLWGAVTTGAISDSASAVVLKNFACVKNASSFTQTINSSIENGTVFYEQVVSLVCNATTAADVNALVDLGKTRLTIVAQDVNDAYWVVGHTRGSELSGGSIATGAAIGDLSGFTLEFTAQEATPAPSGPSATGGNVTYTPV